MKRSTRGQLRRNPQFEAFEQRDLLTSITLLPDQDTSLFEDAAGGLANGAGEYLFVGRSSQADGQSLRRGLLRFDLADQIPVGATISSVRLELTMSRTVSDTVPVALHRVLADWGEGTSDAGAQEGKGAPATPNDATWLHRRFPQARWTNAGGDFVSEASGTTDVGANGKYIWSDAKMIADLEHWLETPAENFGWLLQGNESSLGTAKRFDSRERSVAANRPRLVIDFEQSVPASMSMAGAAAPEGDEGTKPLSFAVTLSKAVSQPVTVQFRTIAGTATEGVDFQPVSGSLEFTPQGPLVQTIDVQIVGDRIVENDETFVVELHDPVGVELQNAQAQGTIQNDDQQPAAPWHNADLPEDVTADGSVDPLDALLVINYLNEIGAGPLPPPSETNAPPPFLDVDGDNQVAPIDALSVINYLNDPPVPAPRPAVAMPAGSQLATRPIVDAAWAAVAREDDRADRRKRDRVAPSIWSGP